MRSGRVTIRVWSIALAAVSLSVVTTHRSIAQEPPPSTAASEPATGSGASPPPAPSAAPGRQGPGSQATEGSNLQSYKLLRYDEDYSDLKDPSRRTDPLDFLKYIPLGGRDGAFLSLGGTARPRYESYHNPGFGLGPASNDDFLQRYLLHGDLHLGPNLRFFGQLESGFESGRIGGPRPEVDLNRFDAHQGFVDLAWRWGAEDANSLTLRPGRQEMSYGSGRLIDVREGSNLRRSFDAASD